MIRDISWLMSALQVVKQEGSDVVSIGGKRVWLRHAGHVSPHDSTSYSRESKCLRHFCRSATLGNLFNVLFLYCCTACDLIVAKMNQVEKGGHVHCQKRRPRALPYGCSRQQYCWHHRGLPRRKASTILVTRQAELLLFSG